MARRELSAVTAAVRVGWLAAAAAATVWHESADGVVACGWAALREASWFRCDSAEPLAVVAAFAMCNIGWWLVDTRGGGWAARWRLRPRHARDMSHWAWQGGHRLRGEALWYLATLLAYDHFHPRRVLPEAPPSLARLAAETAAALLLYDALFFCAHVAYHKVPFLYRAIHAKHHSKAVMRACEAVRVSPLEQALDVSCSIMALKIVGAHPLSRMLYNLIIVYLITELHCGYDMPWMLANVVPFGLWAGSREHEYHHAVGRHYFQKFGTHLDWACGLLPRSRGALEAFYRGDAEVAAGARHCPAR
eukprot:jgi/Tetstr1/437650/TSEL_026317.t1